MALTKIFTGMAQGPETIDANFNDLDGKINTVDSKTDVKVFKLAPVGDATDPCIMTVIGDALVNLQFSGKYSAKGGITIYWMDAKYAPKNIVSFAVPHNNTQGTQMVMSIGTNGAIVLVGNTDDVSLTFGSYAYNCTL